MYKAIVLGLLGVLAAFSASAQQKTGPGVPADDSLTWQGITLYGVVDVGLQYDTHSAPFTPYRPAASGNIVRSNDYQTAFGLTPSNMGQSRVGLRGVEPLVEGLKAIFQIETFFNPQSGQLADSLRSLAANNGKAVSSQNIGVDGSSAGQAFQTAFVGVQSDRFGSLTVGRQVTLLSEGTIKYDPNYNATAFGLLGASNTYSGAGSSETNRLNSTAKYSWKYRDLMHVAGLYQFNGASGSAQTAVQADVGAAFAGASIDAYYSKISSAITGTALTAAQVTTLPTGAALSNSLAATVSDNTAYALMGLYELKPLKFFAGYENIKYANPKNSLSAGTLDLGGYVLAYVNNSAYTEPKIVQVFWTGMRYSVIPHLELTAAYYQVHQSAYGNTAATAGCGTTAHSTCSGNIQALSFDADYRFNVHLDIYAGAMYSSAHGGLGSGYLYSTNINPTLGARFKF
ncbi:MAG TPA: porin [Steroidobacteraceae bacterium]|nr:porin [Steroidobacteraceae bacterium]